MGYNKLFNIIKCDDKTKNLIANISKMENTPYILSEVMSILDDNSELFNSIGDKDKEQFVNLIKLYFENCFEYWLDFKDIEKAIKYGKIKIYKVEAANGLRFATVNEIEQGVSGLLGEYIYPAGENEFKMLSLLMWTFTGISYYFRCAGYSLSYNKDSKVIETFCEMIAMCVHDLKKMIVWLSNEEKVDKALRIMNKFKKTKGYKYASFERDEITEDISIKQLIHNIDKEFPRNSTNNLYRKAIALVIKTNRDNQRLEPLEVAELRRIYRMYLSERTIKKSNENKTNEELKSMCERILSERDSGKIDPKHFAYVIIDTLKKKNYSKCSDKQYRFIADAINILDNNIDNSTEVITDIDIDSSLSDLSNAIGLGIFEN